MLYGDDIVLCTTRREEVENKLEEWRRAMEYRGMEISRKKIVYMRFNGHWNEDGNSDINLQGENLESVHFIRNLFSLSAVLMDELWLHVIVTGYVLIGETACNTYILLLLLFKYLAVTLTENGKSEWKNWKRGYRVFCVTDCEE